MGEASSLFIPEPVSPSSPSVSGDELGVCGDCGGRGGMGGSGWVFPHRQLSYLASFEGEEGDEGMTGQAKQTELRCEVIHQCRSKTNENAGRSVEGAAGRREKERRRQ